MTGARMSRVLCAAVTLLLCGAPLLAQPDITGMSGVPLPVGDLSPGTVTVRVLRGALTNPVTSQTVEVTGAGGPRKAVTNDAGRAEFTGIPPGSRVKASAVVGGTRVESQEFAVPASGGIRLMLVVDPGAAGASPPAPAPAASRGSVVLGDESRLVFETGEDGLSVFYILQIQNPSASPVEPPAPVEFSLPEGARSAALLQGSSPQASVVGQDVKVTGPFAPGLTLVQVGYTLPYSGPELSVEQRFPLPLQHVAVVAQKVGAMRLQSPQIAEQREMPAQGNLYIAGRGGAVPAGQPLQFTFTGMPHHPAWPRTLALGLAIAVLASGAWASLRPGDGGGARDSERKALEAQRDRFFEELADLEERHREHSVDPERYAERRRELVASLERVYIALDQDATASSAS